MDIGSLDSFLFCYTESELRHRGEPSDVLSPRYRRIPQVNFAGRDMYLFSFNSLMEGRSICVNKESRFTFIPEHIHTVIEFLYVYAGHCTQVIDGRRVEMSAGDICLLDTNVPHSIEYLNESDIVITIEMRKEYLTRGFLQRLGDNAIINHFLVNALSADTAHDQHLLFRRRRENGIHSIIQSILCEYYDPQLCSGQAMDACMVLLYCMSSVYHGLPASTGKKVLQILDHCAIYFMIAGTYMPIMLCALRPLYPGLAWTVFGLQWALTALAVTFTAIDLKQYAALSMVCYILMGWCVIFFVRPIIQVMTMAGFWLLLFGGLSYTLGAILYGIGSKKPYFHSAFHVFVLLGSGFQFWAIYAYALPG